MRAKNKVLKPHHKIGAAVVVAGLILAFLGTDIARSVSSYFVIAGFILIVVGFFIIDPAALP